MKKVRLELSRLARLASLCVGLYVGATASGWGCNAPFIPTPPPGQTATFTSALVADGAGGQKTVWIAHGPPNPPAARAHFLVFDTTRMAGVIAQALDDGSYTSPAMDGDVGDRVQISYETPEGALSKSTCFQLTTEIVMTPDQQQSAPICPAP
jgi:hypothetical protein